ncbi:MAG: ComEC/Rec2 family competence protein [Bryobacterales bacterium]|nr:ComEC/Rec2 family competence protein [Bryobacteraceae bacterium]MDW8355016.1 ComEC/Rec2 family competence protein [Bryobacterales bacterium]
MREPLLAPAVALAAGIAISRLIPFSSAELLPRIGALALLGWVAARRGSRPLATVAVCLAVFFAGIWLERARRPGPPPVLDAAPREVVLLEGCVVEPPLFFADRQRFVLELAPGARAQVTLYRREGEAPPRLVYGQRIELEAKVRSPRNYGNPGAFDYESYLARRHIYWLASARASTVRTLPGTCGSPFWSAVYKAREKAIERLDRLYQGNAYATGMMRAILIGDEGKLERVWTETFRLTGTYHAIVISGLHLAAFAAVFLFLVRVVSLPHGPAFVATAAVAWFYALITGAETPVVRAAWGLSLYLIARYCYRRPRLLNLLATVAILFLVWDPHQLFEASFQLSFLCILTIGALALPVLERTSAPLARGLSDLSNPDRDVHLAPRIAQFRVELRLIAETVTLLVRIPPRYTLAGLALLLRLAFYAYELLVVSAATQAGLALPMVVYFHRLSWSGLSANLLVVPLMSLVVPLGLLAVATGSDLAGRAAAVFLEASRRVVEWHAAWEPAWRVPPPPLWLAVALVASLVALALSLRQGRRWRVAVVAFVALLGVVAWHPFRPKVRGGTLELTVMDVGQGDGLLVAFPDGKLMVVDAGGVPQFLRQSRFDTGEQIVGPYLWSRSIRRLDAIVMSHAHEDHMGGLASLIRNFQPGELWHGAVPETPSWRELRTAALGAGVRLRRLDAGHKFRFGGAEIEVLAPPENYEPGERARNDDSLVLRIRYGTRSVLLTGDAEKRTERFLVERGVLSASDVLKVAHHGSRSSTTEPFLERVSPVFAIISAGKDNLYGYPHPEVIERLRAKRVTVLGTSEWGAITLRTDGVRWELGTHRWSRALWHPWPVLAAFVDGAAP